MNYIKIKIINPNAKENDTEKYIRVDQIITLTKANRQDKNIRAEINCVIGLIDGSGYATDKSCEQILEQIKDAEL